MLSRVLADFVMNNFRRSCTRAYIHERVYNYLLSCLLLKAGLLTTWPIELLFFLERAQLAGDAATLGYVLTGLDASKNWPWRRTRAKHTPQVYKIIYIYIYIWQRQHVHVCRDVIIKLKKYTFCTLWWPRKKLLLRNNVLMRVNHKNFDVGTNF